MLEDVLLVLVEKVEGKMPPDAVVGLQAANRRWPLLWPHGRDDMRDVGLFQGVLVPKSKETVQCGYLSLSDCVWI